MVTPGYLAFHPNPKKPDHALPPDACDAHCHVFGPAATFPFASTSTYVPVDAPKETLFQRHRHLGVDARGRRAGELPRDGQHGDAGRASGRGRRLPGRRGGRRGRHRARPAPRCTTPACAACASTS